MRYNGTTVPTFRDNTYDTGEVVRPDMDRRSDWETSDSEDASFIRNKPVLAQADWNEVDDSAPSFIRNKPDVDFDEILTASESINEQLPEMEELLEEMQETDVVKLSAEVTDLKSEISDLENNIYYKCVSANLADDSEYTIGAIQSSGTISTEGVWGDQRTGEMFEVEPSTTYYYYGFTNGVKNTYRRNWLFYDENKTVISGSYGTDGVVTCTMTSPANAKWARVSWNYQDRPCFVKTTTDSFIPYEVSYINKLKYIKDDAVVTIDELIADFVSMVKNNKNLINPAELATGKFMVDDGSLVDLANYSTTDFIPVKSGQSITVSPKIRSAGFFNEIKGMIADSYVNSDTQQPSTFTATADGYFRCSIYTSDKAFAQAEYGTEVTPYEPYNDNEYIESGVHLSDTMEQDVRAIIEHGNAKLHITLQSDYNKTLTIATQVGSQTLQRMYSLNGFQDRNRTFNFHRAQLGPTTIKNSADDITPQRLKVMAGASPTSWTIGANHGWACYAVPKGSLTVEDTGSIWTDGTRQYTLMVVDATRAYFAYPCEMVDGFISWTQVAPSTNLTHISGATHTATVSISGGGVNQLYPSVNHKSLHCFVDDNEITEEGAYDGSLVRVVEHYEIMNYVAMVDYMQNHIGSDLLEVCDNIQPMLALDYVYLIDELNEVVYSSATAIQETTLADCGYMQSQVLEGNNGTVYRYANGVNSGSLFNSETFVDMTNYSTDNYIRTTNLVDSSKPTNRCVDLSKDANGNILYGFVFGFIPDKGFGADAKRSQNSYIWDMRGSKKSYPSCITNKSLAEGETVDIVGYRHYIMPNQDITNRTVVNIGNEKYVFIDAHEAISSNIDIDDYGKPVAVLDTVNMTVSDFVGARGISFYSDASYSSAVLKVD